jgi:hypothetical protein
VLTSRIGAINLVAGVDAELVRSVLNTRPAKSAGTSRQAAVAAPKVGWGDSPHPTERIAPATGAIRSISASVIPLCHETDKTRSNVFFAKNARSPLLIAGDASMA